MEDLFIDSDNFSDNDLFNSPNQAKLDRIKNTSINDIIENNNENDVENINNAKYLLSEYAEKDFNNNYDELALNSFENLNLEDFKRGTNSAINNNSKYFYKIILKIKIK